MKKIGISKEELDRLAELEVGELVGTFDSEQKEVLMVLRFHLHAENLLERIILVSIDRADKLLEKAGLSFHQKLCLVEALSVVDDRYLESLRKINKLRNNCAHMKSASISMQEIEMIGRPLGKEYTKLKKECGNDVVPMMEGVFAKVGGHLVGRTLFSEFSVDDVEDGKESKAGE